MIKSYPKPQTVRLKGKARTEFRKKVFDEKGPFCYRCKRYAPLYVEDYSGREVYIEGRCGEVRHIRSTGSGGPDVMDNADWACWECHRIKEHGPRFGESHFTICQGCGNETFNEIRQRCDNCGECDNVRFDDEI